MASPNRSRHHAGHAGAAGAAGAAGRAAASGAAGSVLGAHPAGQSRDALVAEVARCLDVLPSEARLVVAVSGGPDSTALAYLIAESRPDLNVTLAHVRHGLRDDTEDIEVVRRHAAWLGQPLLIREVEVERRGRGTEAAARDARYETLRALAAGIRARGIAVGHTADDQAETVLLRAARGTGIDGLGAMAVVGGDLLRPLLRVRRADVHRFLVLEGLPSVTDPTNDDPRIRRVAVRTEVLPTLEQIGPDPVGALARLAALARDDADALRVWAGQVIDAEVRWVGPVATVADDALERVPVAVRRRVLRHLLVAVAGSLAPPPSASTVARVEALGRGAAVDLPHGLRATAAGGWRAVAPRLLPQHDALTLTSPGTTVWEPAGVQLRVVLPDADAGQLALAMPGSWSPPELGGDPQVVPPGGRLEWARLVVPAGLGPLMLRHRAPGDRIQAPSGSVKLKDVLIDAGLPRPVRALWPVLTDADDRLVWVPGIAAAADVLEAGRHEPGALLLLEVQGRSSPLRRRRGR